MMMAESSGECKMFQVASLTSGLSWRDGCSKCSSVFLTNTGQRNVSGVLIVERFQVMVL